MRLSELASTPSNSEWLSAGRLPPRCLVTFMASEQRADIVVTVGASSTTVIIDLATRERVIAVDGDDADRVAALRVGRDLAAAKDEFDRKYPPTPRIPLARFRASSPSTWTSLQWLGALTGARWQAPPDWGGEGRAALWRWLRETRRVNRALHGAISARPHPVDQSDE
ncbi:hypothetical protein DEI90_09840 [Curtobacterium sp. MCBD17_031]|nr:hypothetical protein DEI90_09840 [Curtobacterium sp. MCBD17_031]